MKIIDLIRESRFESGRGSAKGRSIFTSKEGTRKKSTKARKGRVRIFKSIAKALQGLDYGSIFSTVASDRLYVVTKPTWGDKSVNQGSRVAKGFAAGTPFSEIRGYAARTMKKHGGKRSKRLLNYKEQK